MIHMGILIKQLALFRIIAWRCKLILANAVFECCVCRLAAPGDTGVAGTGIAIACCPTGQGQTRTTRTGHTGRRGGRSSIIFLRASVFSDSRADFAYAIITIIHCPLYRTTDPIAADRSPRWYLVLAFTCITRPNRDGTHTKNLSPDTTISIKFTSRRWNCCASRWSCWGYERTCFGDIWHGVLAGTITDNNNIPIWWTSEPGTVFSILIIIPPQYKSIRIYRGYGQ